MLKTGNENMPIKILNLIINCISCHNCFKKHSPLASPKLILVAPILCSKSQKNDS